MNLSYRPIISEQDRLEESIDHVVCFSCISRNHVDDSGSVHPMLTITHTSYSCHDVLEKKSADSSPSHSQMSRNSSRKSNNSLLVNNGKLEGTWKSRRISLHMNELYRATPLANVRSEHAQLIESSARR